MDDSLPKVDLSDSDGNAYNVIGLCMRAARKAGWSREKLDAVRTEMQSGDYDHLLQTAMKHFNVE